MNLLSVEPGENVRALLTVRDFTEAKYVVMATRAGKIKKTELTAFSNVRTSGIIAIDINEGDDLHSVQLSDGNGEIFIGTHNGMAIRFHESDVRPMGRGAAGVKAITLRDGDHVVEMDVLPETAEGRARALAKAAEGDEEPEIVETEAATTEDESEEILATDDAGQAFTVTERGFGKRTPVTAYRLQSRGGMGVTNIKVTEKNGKVAGIAHVTGDEQVLLITEQGMIIRVECAGIRVIGRSTQGVRIINVEENDRVVAAIKLVEREQDEEGTPADGEPDDSTGEPGDSTPDVTDDTVH